MRSVALLVALLLAVAASAQADEICKNPDFAFEYYSTPELVVSRKHTAFAAQFSLTCNGKRVKNARLHAVVGGELVSIASSESGEYQVSWTRAHSAVSNGENNVELYTDNDYAEYRKAVRDSTPLPKPSFTVPLYHAGASNNQPLLPAQYVVISALTFVLYYAFRLNSHIHAKPQ